MSNLKKDNILASSSPFHAVDETDPTSRDADLVCVFTLGSTITSDLGVSVGDVVMAMLSKHSTLEQAVLKRMFHRVAFINQTFDQG